MFAVLSSLRKTGLGLVAGVGALVLSGCEPGAITGGGPTINTAEPVPVALLLPRGSGQSSDAVVARSLENAARLAIADLPAGVQIDLRVYDTQGSAATAGAQAVKAVDEGAQIILGPVYGEAANAAGVAVANRNVNVLSFSNNSTIAGGNLFILGPTFENTAGRLTRYAARQDRGRIAVVHSNDLAGSLGRNAIQQSIAATSGANLAGTVPYSLSQQGVIAAVPTVRDTVSGSGANALFLTSTTAGALPLFTQLLPESGVTPENVQYIGLTRWDIPPQTAELPGVQGGWFALPDPGRSQGFRGRYQSAYGQAPHPIGGLAYDGIAAIGALVSNRGPDALTAASLTRNAGFQGTGGIFRLRPDGTNQRGLAIATIENKQVVVIDPAPTSFAGAGL
ncbi:MAG: penicillin-binding protein activator [Pseudomonadota bacterium]